MKVLDTYIKGDKEIIKYENGRTRVRTINEEKTRTQQQFKDQCDVNNIMSKYLKTGEIHHLARKAGVYADVSNITDYHGMLLQVQDAANAFMALPSSIRIRFNNDPQELLQFLQDPKNLEEGTKLGLFEPKKTETSEPQTNRDDSNNAKKSGEPKTKTKTAQSDDDPT